MKKHNIKLSFNTHTATHSLKRIIGYYYNEYIELNTDIEKMSEDEYSKMMIAKGENAKTEKQRNKIAEDYAQNMQKYHTINKSCTTLSYINQLMVVLT